MLYLIFNLLPEYYEKTFYYINKIRSQTITNVYTESGKYTTSTVCDYAKSAIDTNNKTVMALNFECIATIIKSKFKPI